MAAAVTGGGTAEIEVAVGGVADELTRLVAKSVDALGWVFILTVLRNVARQRNEPLVDGVLQGAGQFIESRCGTGRPAEA